MWSKLNVFDDIIDFKLHQIFFEVKRSFQNTKSCKLRFLSQKIKCFWSQKVKRSWSQKSSQKIRLWIQNVKLFEVLKSSIFGAKKSNVYDGVEKSSKNQFSWSEKVKLFEVLSQVFLESKSQAFGFKKSNFMESKKIFRKSKF